MQTFRETVDQELDARFDPQHFADRRVTVVVPDATRPIHYGSMVGPLLERLADAGAEVTVLVGLGLHRPMHDDEIAQLRALCDRLDVALDQHDARAADLVELAGDVADGHPDWPALPARFNRHVAEAERIITVGTVEPHQYAGFSGGAKGVAIGSGSHATISAMHGLEFLRDERTRLGRTDANPFQQALWALIEPTPPAWGLQIVPRAEGERSARTEAHFGPVDEAFERAVDQATERFFRPVDRRFDWLHLPVPDEKASNFYQASRAATYVALTDRPAITRGGTLILEAACPEGIGRGDGERACAEAMRRGRDTLLDELRGASTDEPVETRGGQQRAYVIAKALDHCEIVLVGAPPITELDAMGIAQYDSLEDAHHAEHLGARGTTIDDTFHGVPVLSP